ncbi:MAG: hypothetical protein RL634_1046 [Bacteroidota bacterium]|jgi:hypothetical protein
MRNTLLLFIFLFPLFALSQDATVFEPDSIRKSIQSQKISTSIKIDGILNENEWKLSPSSPRFTMIEPFQGNTPNHETEVKVLFNKNFLYVGVYARDTMGKKAIRAIDFKRDFNFMAHDMVTLSFDGFNDKRNAMAFAVNPYGVQRDLLAFDDAYYDVDWDGLWKTRTSRTDSGWYAEVAIPWKTLRYHINENETQEWGFNVYRNRRLTNEISAFSPFPRSFTSLRMNYAGVLKGLQPPPPQTNIRVQPYLLTSFEKESIDGIKTNRSSSFKIGGEVKWGINPNSILDITFNTDFAQADADRQVNNVTRFSVFFPERRQFFLENASLFGIGIKRSYDESGGNMHIQPFFSRRIGLDDNGNPIPIEAGGRYVYRSDKRNFGALLMRQRGTSDMSATNFFVGRFSENFGKQNRIGGMLSVKDQTTGSNTVGTIDGFFRLGASHSLSTMVSVSNTSATNKQGLSAYAQYFFVNNQFKIWWTQSIVSKNYDPQLGFVSRNDVVGTTPGIFWWYRGKNLPFKKWLRAWEPSIFPEFYHSVSTGKLIEKTIGYCPVWLNLQSGAFFGLIVFPTYQYLTETFQPLGVTIQQGAYNYNRKMIYASTDPSKKLNLMTLYSFGEYFNGNLRSGEWTLQFAPLPQISFQTKFNRNRFSNVGANATNTKVDLLAFEGRFALNPRVQLIGFYQQNTENNSKNYNVRFSWEYKPLSYIYFVINHREFQTVNLKTQMQDQSIVKFSYLKQF